MTEPEPYTQPAVAGSGTIACGLAASASAARRGSPAGAKRRLGLARRGARSGGVREGRGRRAGPDPGDHGPGRPLGVRPGRRGRDRGPRREGPAARLARRRLPRGRPREHHLVPVDGRARGPLRPSAPAVRPSRLQPGATDGAGRALPARRAAGGSQGAGPRLVPGARQDGDRGSRPAGVRRQPPALPLPVRRRSAGRANRDGERRRRLLHRARGRAPDGAAAAARLHRARRGRGDRREPVRRHG